MDMKWLDNLITVFACGETGVCPYCGSPDADHGFTVIKKDTRMGYGSVWCNTCKRGDSSLKIDCAGIRETAGSTA